MTVGTYGHLVPGASRAAVDRLDDATGRNLDATKVHNPATTETQGGA